MSDGRLGTVLSAQPWRFLRALQHDRSRAADPILRSDERLDCEQSVTLCYELHHVILPELADAGLVEFDRREDEVSRGPEFEAVRPAIERAVVERRERGSSHTDDGTVHE